MNQTVASSVSTSAPTTRLVRTMLPIAILLVLAAGLVGYGVWRALQTGPTPPATEFMSAAQLEERHGLAVRLIGVTGGGGMIDFRLKMLDGEKARKFLEDPANLPRLIVADSGEALMGTEELDDDVSWEEGGILFILFSNSGGLIQPGTPVIVEFGDVQLEPIIAQ
jgi:hypothetical protein